MTKIRLLDLPKYIICLGILCFITNCALSQSVNITITGTVRSDSSVLNGVTITVKSSNKTVGHTKEDGTFKVVAPSNGTLVFSCVGYQNLEEPIQGNTTVNVKLEPSAKTLDEVVTVGFGRQKKESVVGSVVSVTPKDLKGPTSNLTTMLAGRIAGMVAYQRSGEPGSDNASFFIRGLGSFGSGKVEPLILIDQVESSTNDLARLQPDDIASFSVLKDATAAAVYGARGANGVLIIMTKSGIAGNTEFGGRVENSVSSNTRNFKFSDNIDYMKLANEAALTRDPLAGLTYSQLKIDRTQAGDNPLLYPNNNWINQLIEDYTVNQRYNMSVSGGAAKARYYLAGTYNVDNGLLRHNELNGFNNNIKLQNYSVRSNVDLKFTNTLSVAVRVYGQFDDYRGPIGDRDQFTGIMGSGGTKIFNQAIWSNPVMFPAIYPQSYLPYVHHPLFGNAIVPGTIGALYSNPYANMMSGYAEYNTSTLQAQIEVKQDLNKIVRGLNFNAMAYTRRYAYFDVSRSYNPFYYTAMSLDNKTISDLLVLNDGSTGSVGTTGTEYLNYNEGVKYVTSTFYGQASLNYARSFNQHEVSGMVIGIMQSNLKGNAGSLEASLPGRNVGVSGRVTYGFDKRYLAEFDFGYNGSERFAADSRFGFFPSFGLAWNVANEDFFKPLTKVVTNLKLRGTLGWVGNDQIGNSTDRFFYLSNVNMSNNDYSYQFGLDYLYSRPGISIYRYSNPNITWERSRQLNIGMDLTLWNALTLTVDAYKNIRSNILLQRSYIPSTMGLQAAVSANVGKAQSSGVDLMLNYNKSFGANWWLQSRANLTYAKSKILVYDEPQYVDKLKALSRVGYSIAQAYGYVAERLFTDDAEVGNSPRQTFSQYMAGDIKYHDMDGDGQITSNDMVPIGYPTTPEVIYGFGFSVGYKKFDISSFFQGSARSSFFINSQNISPFVRNGGSQNGLLKAVKDDHWSEDNRNSYAFWPRLSNYFVGNNNQSSTWWMRDGTFLRMKNLEIGYSFTDRFLDRVGFKTARLYVNGANLFVWSKFKMWDPEMGGNGLGYPIQRVYNIGVNFKF